MDDPSQSSQPVSSDQPPPTVGDGYLLPEYSSAFIRFIDDAQWYLVFENSPIVKEAFAGQSPYAIPESFGRSISTVGNTNDSPMHIETSGIEFDFNLTRKQILAGDYCAFTESIGQNLPKLLESIVPVVIESMQDQGALVKFDRNANFWDKLLDWLERSNLHFSEKGIVSFDHLKIFGKGDVAWINDVPPSTEQVERWQNIIEKKRTEYFATQGHRRLTSDIQNSDREKIWKTIKLIQNQKHEEFLRQYATPEYENAQVQWIHGLAQYEIMRSPSLTVYYQLYVKLGLHEAASTGTSDDAAYYPQRRIVVREVMPIFDVLAGNYVKRHQDIRMQIDAIRSELVQDAIKAIKSIQKTRGVDSGVAVIKDFNWDFYLDRLEGSNTSFDAWGNPILPSILGSYPKPPPINEVQRIRLESIITEKRDQYYARRTSRRRISD